MRDLNQNMNLWALPLLGLMLYSCGKAPKENATTTSAEDGKIQTVEVVNPSYHSFSADVRIIGTVHANRSVMLHAMESGYVSEMKKDIGDRVQKGEVLAKLENPELVYLQEQLEAEVKAAKGMYDRLLDSHEKTPDLTPQQVLDNAEAKYLGARSKLEVVKTRIEYLQVRAPFSCTITARLVDEGALIQGGISDSDAQALFKIEELDPIRVIIPVPGADAANVEIGTKVQIEFPELAGDPFAGIVSRTSGSLDPSSRTMQVEIDIPNGDGKIKPGMYAKVEMHLESRDSVLSLPASAQHIMQDAYFLMTVNNGIVELIELKKGLADPNYFEVLNAEIDQNTMVITQGRALIKEGQQVEAILKKEQP